MCKLQYISRIVTFATIKNGGEVVLVGSGGRLLHELQFFIREAIGGLFCLGLVGTNSLMSLGMGTKNTSSVAPACRMRRPKGGRLI